jgi:hypothetical protein
MVFSVFSVCSVVHVKFSPIFPYKEKDSETEPFPSQVKITT